MGLLSRVVAAGRMFLRDAPLGPAGDPITWWGYWHGAGGIAATGELVNAKTAISLPAFNACVSLLSSSLAAQRWGIEKELPEGGSEALAGPADAALALMSYGAKEKFVSDALVFGTGYCARVFDQGGRLNTLVALPTELMLVQLGTDISYVYSDPLTHLQTRFLPNDLAILKYRNWGFRPWLGIPPLLTIGDTLGVALAARGLASSEFRNGTQLAGYLSTANKLDRQKAEDIRDRWRGAYAGVDRAFKTPVLEQGLEYKQITSRDMAALQLAELARMSDMGVCMAFNVPPSSIGLIDKTTRSTIEDESRRLVSLALQPLAVRVGDAVGQLLLSGAERASGMRVSINLESLVRGFGLELSEALSRYVLGGIMSRSEARRAIGLPGRADTDPMFQPVNVETTEQATARQDRADQAAADASAAASSANDNVNAGLVDELKRLQPHGIDIGGGLEGSSVVVRLPTGQEVQVDLADIRKVLAVEPEKSSVAEDFPEAAE